MKRRITKIAWVGMFVVFVSASVNAQTTAEKEVESQITAAKKKAKKRAQEKIDSTKSATKKKLQKNVDTAKSTATDKFNAAKEKVKKQYANGMELHHLFGVDLAYYPATHKGLNTKNFGEANYKRLTYKDMEKYPGITHGRNDLGNPMSIELKAYYTFQMYFPAMQKDNMLMKDNNVKVNVVANLSPVTFETGLYVEWTPLAFLVFDIGTKVGTGWDFPLLGINGAAINDPNFGYSDDQSMLKGTQGVMSISKMQATLQFDIGAVVPGDWTHVVFAIVENVEYQYFSAASNDQYWVWEADKGENQNGFMWYQKFLIGYQMPTVKAIDTIGFLIETEQRITGKNKSKMKDGGWGSDFMETAFGPLINFQLAPKHQLAILAEFINYRHYTDASMKHRYFENRQVDTSNPTYVQFYRIAFSYNMKY